ncbi:bifunctional DNA primase/polymerase [Serinicoccus sediminis]|uniref:bifunctional DNA primase/polymerase n=1 Tax=Serinicoccus sediminis TaxID=2306021 RepID=UPI002357895B|nr:bifunctional DNA primase/polymerase [Serinicoccus sediminis]
MSAPDDTPTTGPYGDHALHYLRAGWAPLPLPPRAKKHPPAGWTGRDGATPSGPDVHAWTEDHPDGNIALRMPPDVLGIDVDAYDSKPGGLVLDQLETTHGSLPATWRSTSRDDGTSGIRFYTVPPGLRWPSVLGPGIETIRREHRYAVAWPSTHPDHGGTYRWISPDGTTTIGTIPTPGDLPALPDAWVSHFTGGELAPDTTTAGLTTAATTAWLDQAPPGHPCRAVQAATTRAHTDLTNKAGARHDTALRAVHRLVWLAAEGHPGTTTALAEIQAAFLAATGTDRAPGEAEAEYARLITGSIDIAAAHHPTPATTPDPCTDPFAGLIDRSTTPCPPPATSSHAPSAPLSSSSSGLTAPSTDTSGSSGTADAPATAAAEPSATADPDTVERTTWWPRDNDLALDDDTPEPPPAFLTRDDGHALFYPGRVNGIVAPSESGKTWIALLAVVQATQAGHRTTILDFEDSHRGITSRLRAMGLTRDQIRAHIAYIGPDEPFSPYLPTGRDLHQHLADWTPHLVIVDGFNAAMTLQGLDLMSNKDATSFSQTILKPLAHDGAAVVYIDHTPKDTENKSSGGIGAQAKRAMTTGCAIRVEVIKQFGKGQEGKLRLRVDKDRQGDVRGASLPGKTGHWAGDITIAPGEHDDAIDVQLHAPGTGQAGDTTTGERPAFRPTALMERVSTFLQTCEGGASRRVVTKEVRGKEEYIVQALDTLVAEGYVDRHEETGRGGARMVHTHVRAFVELSDPGPPESASQLPPKCLPGGGSSASPGSASPSRSPYGETEALRTARVDQEPPPDTPSASRIVERTIAGQRVRINLDTGEVID